MIDTLIDVARDHPRATINYALITIQLLWTVITGHPLTLSGGHLRGI